MVCSPYASELHSDLETGCYKYLGLWSLALLISL